MAQQQSIRSFFQPRQQPNYSAPPSSSAATTPPSSSAPGPADNNSTASPIPSAPAPAPPTVSPTIILPDNLPNLPSPPSLPPQASIVPLNADHIPALRRINSLLLPVAYPDSFYARALDPLASGLFSRAILWQDSASSSSDPKVIGGIVCRLEPNPLVDPTTGQKTLSLQLGPRSQELVPPPTTPYYAIYIQSLTLLSPYRSQGLAAAALEHIIASAALLPTSGANIDVRTIYAHVWTENEEGLKWYAARGFKKEGTEPVKGYYFKLRPDTAWIIQRDIGPDATPPPPGGQIKGAWPSAAGTPPVSVSGGTVAAAVNLPAAGGPPRRPSATPSPSASSLSFQNARPETEWNDLPADMVAGGGNGRLAPGSGQTSAASSRSSSAVRKKKERAYHAFGS
ncbi:hypothetical protein OQA88_4728 [Cercophora sp. LCS_1]